MKTPTTRNTRNTRSTARANPTPKSPANQKTGIMKPMKRGSEHSDAALSERKRVRFQDDDCSWPSTPKKNRIQKLVVPKAPRISSRIKPYNPIVFIEEDPIVQDLIDENEELRWMVYDLQQNKAKAEERGAAALLIMVIGGLVWSYY